MTTHLYDGNWLLVVDPKSGFINAAEVVRQGAHAPPVMGAWRTIGKLPDSAYYFPYCPPPPLGGK